jgi:DNA-binding transcriptional MocR family regulator
MRLAAAIRIAIRDGRLLPATRLPPERRMATHLGVGRNTVVRAYELLQNERLVERRQGSGTIVRVRDFEGGGRAAELSSAVQRHVVFQLVTDAAEDLVDLLSAHAPPISAVQQALQESAEGLDAERLSRHPGYFPLGYPPLRDAIAGRLTMLGVATAPEQVLVTTGAQQAITLVANTMGARRNVVVEDPTFPGAIDAFRAAGARLLAVPVSEQGLDPDRLGWLIQEREVVVAYLMPTFHNPTGILIGVPGRLQLAQLAQATQTLLVEDDTLAEIAMGEDAPVSIAAFDSGGSVLSIGSLGKLFWGGLRVGWIRGPAAIVAQLGRVKAAADLGSSVVSQAMAVSLLERADAIRDVRRRELQNSLQTLEELLKTHLGDWTWWTPKGGLSLWARLPYGSSTELAKIAQEHRVSIVPGPVMSAIGSFDDHVRLPLGRESHVVATGIERLAAAWDDYRAQMTRSGRRLDVVV